MNNLTDRDFWASYWSDYQYNKIPSKMVYEEQLKQCAGLKSFIEIGGFPGIHAAYFYKKIAADVTILDFYVDKQMVQQLEKFNGIPEDTIKCIESDFFSFHAQKKYGIVFSNGFIEHFQDTSDVVRRHVDLLDQGGCLLIVLPNFRGLNGWFQRLFDRENFNAHNLKSMEKDHLRNICESLGLREIMVEYSKKPMIWLEPKARMMNKLLRYPVKLLSYALKLFPIRCRFLSPFIILTAKK